MEDFGDDLFDEFEKPSSSSFTVGIQKSDDGQQNSEEKYVTCIKSMLILLGIQYFLDI